MIDNSPAPSRLVNADALGEGLKFYPRRSRLKSSRGPARNEHMSAALPPCVDGSELARTFFTYAELVGAPMCSAF